MNDVQANGSAQQDVVRVEAVAPAPAVTAERVPVALPLALADCSSRGCASADSASV